MANNDEMNEWTKWTNGRNDDVVISYRVSLQPASTANDDDDMKPQETLTPMPRKATEDDRKRKPNRNVSIPLVGLVGKCAGIDRINDEKYGQVPSARETNVERRSTSRIHRKTTSKERKSENHLFRSQYEILQSCLP
jgi:hypothetical protein